jgi:hypothetical protein
MYQIEMFDSNESHLSLIYFVFLSGNCAVIKSMLKNKDLREMITNIDSAQDPDMVLRSSMDEPIFSEFVNECVSIVEPTQENNV